MIAITVVNQKRGKKDPLFSGADAWRASAGSVHIRERIENLDRQDIRSPVPRRDCACQVNDMLRQGLRDACRKLPWAGASASKVPGQAWLKAGCVASSRHCPEGRRRIGSTSADPNNSTAKRGHTAPIDAIEGATCEDDTHEIMFYRSINSPRSISGVSVAHFLPSADFYADTLLNL